MASSQFYLNDLGLVSALGAGKQQVAQRLFAGDISQMRAGSPLLKGYRGRFGAIENIPPALPQALRRYDCRNNRLAALVAEQIADSVAGLRARFGAARVAVVVGTSTSGIAATEAHLRGGCAGDYSYRYRQQMAALAEFVADYLQISGPRITVSTACSSSANAFASARRLLNINACDAVVVGGVDTLCGMTVNGFHSLGALSADLAQPFSKNRDGINLGEAGALFVLSRDPAPVRLCGVAGSADAHHMSAPDPSGAGAAAAMSGALADAGIRPTEIGYLNLHGTATRQNDAMEAAAVHSVLGGSIPCSSTKPLTGHTLGAAGALEAALCWLTLHSDYSKGLPPHRFDGEYGDDLAPLQLHCGERELQTRPRYAMSNSFAFGGSNCSIILGTEGNA
jgi:3-oxoacyl-[acyl-carrier-protein] synthase-1